MFGLGELRKRIDKRDNTVGCPVIGCEAQVKRMTAADLRGLDAYLEKERRTGRDFDQFLCQKHKIYITPSTFIYKNLEDNVLWCDDSDKDLLFKILTKKRVKAQLHHENSEDAVTWNVFRFLEKTNLLTAFLGELSHPPVRNPETIYWSYSQSQHGVWDALKKTRREFGELPQRSSEPDIIVKSDNALFFVEAKLTATSKADFSNSHTTDDKKERVRRYGKAHRFLKYPVENIIDAGYYQLMRFWLIGACVAENEGLNFYLLNLVTEKSEENIGFEFGKHVSQSEKRRFLRISWEEIHKYVSTSGPSSGDKARMLGYFRNKAVYDSGALQKAFSIP